MVVVAKVNPKVKLKEAEVVIIDVVDQDSKIQNQIACLLEIYSLEHEKVISRMNLKDLAKSDLWQSREDLRLL